MRIKEVAVVHSRGQAIFARRVLQTDSLQIRKEGSSVPRQQGHVFFKEQKRDK